MKIKPTYDINSLVAFTLEMKPIYIYHRISQLFAVLPQMTDSEQKQFQGRLHYHITKNIPLNNIIFKRTQQFSEKELDNIICQCELSKETDILKYIDFNHTKTL
jgi:translation initiation factor RLI1